MSDIETVQDKLNLLKDKYISSLPQKVTDICHEWDSCKASNEITERTLESHLHKLAGSAGMYDLYDLGEKARALELTIMQPENPLTEEAIMSFETDLKQLKNMVTDLRQE